MDESFPDLSVVSFGAVGDGKTLSTAAIQRAVDVAHARGGGTVILPPGTYLSGTVMLRSGVTLEIAVGATLLGSPDLADYTHTGWRQQGEGGDLTPWHLVQAADAADVRITGGGTIDGNGPAFWEPTILDVPGDPLSARPVREPDPARGRLSWIKADNHRRPSPMILFERCRNARLDGVHLTNSAGWTVHLDDCDHVWIHQVKLSAHLMGPNNDGVDISGCRDVTVSDSHISCCDDAICLKTWPGGPACERVTVTNCVIRTWCAAFKTGEAYGHFRQITFSNSIVYESSRAVALYSVDGGIVEDVTITNITCDSRAPLVLSRLIHMDVRVDTPGKPMGTIRNVLISNVVARTEGRILLTAAPGGKMANIVLRDIHVVYPTVDDPVLVAEKVGHGQLSRSNPDARVARAVVVAENIEGFVLDGLWVTWPETDAGGVMVEPPDWQFPLKAANGTFRVFTRSEFHSPPLPPMYVLWARNVSGGFVRSPMARPSLPGVEPHVLLNCQLTVAEGV